MDILHNQSTPILILISERLAVRRWLKTNLQDHFHIIEERIGSHAINTLTKYEVKYIFIDSHNKHPSYKKVASSIRDIPEYTETPIILITDKLSKDFRTKAIAAGITNFASSQLSAEELLELLKSTDKKQQSDKKLENLAKNFKPSNMTVQKSFSASQKKAAPLIEDHPKQLCVLSIRIKNFSLLSKKIPSASLQNLLLQIKKKIDAFLSNDQLSIPLKNGQYLIILSQTKLSSLVEKLQKTFAKLAFSYKQEKLVIKIEIEKIPYTEKILEQLSSETKSDKIIKAAKQALNHKSKDDLKLNFEIKE